MTEQIVGLPGVKTGQERDFQDRTIRITPENRAYIIAGKVVDGTLSRDPLNGSDTDVLRPGTLMGKVTATKKYATSILGPILNAEIATSVALEVSVATALEIVRRIGTSGTFDLVGPPAASGVPATESVTFTAIDTGTGIITVDATTLAFIAGSFIVPDDGSGVPVALVDDNIFLKVTDRDRVATDVEFTLPLIAGQIDSTQILGWPSDSGLQQYLIDSLNVNGQGNFLFDHFFE
ncbi:hypothetical protein LCGC14_0392470 [marine sediment metagenome]|uniref:Uncharacterized protein n=1 Tax=marine sediment metagenome TaxID=412755 RepID=A0A0F9W8E0_9ZZZZ